MMYSALHRRYGRARRAIGPVWHPGEAARTIMKIPAERPIYPPADVIVEEVQTSRPTRHKDHFGDWKTVRYGARVKVGYGGKSYWVDAEILEKP